MLKIHKAGPAQCFREKETQPRWISRLGHRLRPCFLASILPVTASGNVVINEIHYNSRPNNAADEFIELYNSGPETVDVGGWFFQEGIEFTIPDGTEIPANSYLVIAEDPAALMARYGAISIGPFSGKLSGDGETVELRQSDGSVADTVSYRDQFPWPVGAGGTGASMELINPTLDNDLSGSWRSSTPGGIPPQPSPGIQNTAFLTNAPPAIRQVKHSPKQPLAEESTIITAKVSDPDGVGSVNVEIQTVAPGAYVPAFLAKTRTALYADPIGPRAANPAYHNAENWTAWPMLDDGTGDDAEAGDGIYTITLDGEVNRTLVRYRITVSDTMGASIRVPYADDDSLNFAYYHYDGVPSYTAETRSLLGQPHTYPAETMNSIPVYHVLTSEADFDQAVAYQFSNQIDKDNFAAFSAYNWNCTFVYDGIVHDHVGYRLRQRNARYSGSGKRSLKFRFNRGNYPVFRDRDGRQYSQPWKFLATHKMVGSRNNATWGLDQAVNHRMWNLTGTPAPFTHWAHMRIVRGAEEAPAGTNGQYQGDYYGTLLALEEYDSRFLDSHNLEKGNLYKLLSYRRDGLSVQRYQSENGVSDGSDFTNIINRLRPSRSDEWLNDHVNFDSWNHYHAIADMIRHYDFLPNTGEHLKNRAYYFESSPTNPLGRLRVLPWDSDTSWGPNWNTGTDFPKQAIFGSNGTSPREPFSTEYLNVVREMRDLLWTEEQISLLIEPLADKIADIVPADRDRWRQGIGGRQDDPSLESVIADMKKFAFDGGSWEGGNDGAMPVISRDSGASGAEGRDAYLDALVADSAIPVKPTITYSGTPDFPVDALSFESSDFDDPQGAASFSAMEWRVSEISPVDLSTPVIMSGAATWKFLDDGSNQGSAWKEVGFDDQTWSEATSPLGFGFVNGLQFSEQLASGNVTYYFRSKVNVTDLDLIKSITVKLLVDDAAIVWVNGQEALRDGFGPGTPVTWTTVAGSSGSETVFDTFQINPELFLEGENVIAVEVHNSSPTNSDLGFEMMIDADVELLKAGESPVFEWDADWESEELSTFTSAIDIPSIAKAGQTYRARVRHQDDSGRWSHWSDPVEFVAGAPAIQPWLDGLIIREIMYHPNSPSPTELLIDPTLTANDFEWIEISNIGEDALDLGDVRFTKGIEFDFINGTRTSIAPGENLVIVGNESAFNIRYGFETTPSFVIGTFDKNLSNGGERLKLSFGAGTTIRDFDYGTDLPWPTISDGGDRSLVYIASPTPLLDPDFPGSWRAGIYAGGSPGLDNSTTFTGAPNADEDSNGIADLIDYATPGELSIKITDTGFAELSYLRTLAADDVLISIESARNTWQPLGSDFTLTDEAFFNDGTSELTYRSVAPISAQKIFRLKVSTR